MSTVNTLRNALKPGWAKVMRKKVTRRFSAEERTRREATEWAAERRVPPRVWCSAIDAELWAEARTFGEELRARVQELRDSTGEQIGGRARGPLLYFVTRLTRPKVVLETGVAAGYSSTAFLTALERNGDGGRLLSSDFPYFRNANPEQFVGILVPEALRSNWTLLLEGDEANLPKLLAQVDQVDLYHYDSDKSYAGRRFGIDTVDPKLALNAVVMMDDINDNVFFRDYSSQRAEDPFLVFGKGEYCVGAYGLPPMPTA